jgi:SNF2 family DNA or RNA helicase
VIDESFYAKNPRAQRSRALRRIRELCGKAFVLCGTPAPNSPNDIIEQFNLVDFGLTFQSIAAPDNMSAEFNEISTAIAERGLYLRHLKQDVLPNLPPKRFTSVRVELAPVQRSLYLRTLTEMTAALRTESDQAFERRIVSYLASRVKLMQICSNPSGVEPGYAEIPAKLKALDAILRTLIAEQAEKVVVWSFFSKSIQALKVHFDQYEPLVFDGSIQSVDERRLIVDRFQNDPNQRLLIANPAAAGAGLTLHAARYAIYESFSNQPAHYMQSLDRIHRRGQSRDVEYIILMCGATIDEVEYGKLLQKEIASQALLRDDVLPNITLTAALEECVGLLSKFDNGNA